MRNVPSLETVYRDYSAEGVKFYYLYKALAHPGLNGYIRPHTLEERLLHIEEAKRTLGSEIPWLADSMENARGSGSPRQEWGFRLLAEPFHTADGSLPDHKILR